jgi:hypothetical protein
MHTYIMYVDLVRELVGPKQNHSGSVPKFTADNYSPNYVYNVQYCTRLPYVVIELYVQIKML